MVQYLFISFLIIYGEKKKKKKIIFIISLYIFPLFLILFIHFFFLHRLLSIFRRILLLNLTLRTNFLARFFIFRFLY
jgi:hypothetical protein